MLSVNGTRLDGGSGRKSFNRLMEFAEILQSRTRAVSFILSQLQGRGLLAASPARQVAQAAIVSRCGNSVADGISFLEALSVPAVPVKFYGPAAAFRGKPLAAAPNHMLLQGYEGFKSPLPPLQTLPEEHSFVDLFELLLLCSRQAGRKKSVLERAGVKLGTTLISGLTAQSAIERESFAEIVKYTVAEEIAGTRKDIAQFTGRTIYLLGALTVEPLLAQ